MKSESSLRRQEVIRKDWMFKLVGKETFLVGSSKTKATIKIEALSGFAYEYSLEVGGKSLQKFTHDRAQTTKTWLLKVDGRDYRVVLGEGQQLDQTKEGGQDQIKDKGFLCSSVTEKDTMDVWCNGEKMETTVRDKRGTFEDTWSLGGTT